MVQVRAIFTMATIFSDRSNDLWPKFQEHAVIQRWISQKQ